MSDTEIPDAIRDRHLQAHRDALDGLTIEAWIDGESVGADESVATRDPVIDESIVDVPVCDADTVDRAVERGWDAFQREWADTTPAERSRRLFDWIEVLEGHLDELTLLESLDTRKPRAHARGNSGQAMGIVSVVRSKLYQEAAST